MQSRKGGKIVEVCKSCGRGLNSWEPQCNFKEDNEETLDMWFE